MRNRVLGLGILLLTTLAATVVGCSDDPPGTAGTSSSSGSGGSGGTGGSGGSGSTGVHGLPGSELVSGGNVVTSSKYKMVVNFGTSTPAPGVATSPNHRLHGGLIGVTEGVK